MDSYLQMYEKDDNIGERKGRMEDGMDEKGKVGGKVGGKERRRR